MAFEDRTLACKECGAEFVFTAGEQEFYERKGLIHDPTRCPNCRAERRRTRTDGGDFGMGGGGGGGARTLYPVVCASCGKDTEVPFQPRLGRPVYCRDCFALQRS